MKILNINSYYYSSTVHKLLHDDILEQGIDSFTYAPVARGYQKRESCRYGEEEHVKKVECFNEMDRYIFSLKHRKILRNIVQELDIEKYDCLHAHSLFSNGYIAMKMKEKFGIPFIVAVRDTDVNSFFKLMIHLRGLGNKILKEADKVIFLSSPYREYTIDKYVKDEYKEEIMKKSLVVPNGINNFWLDNKNSPKSKPLNDEIKLVYVGGIMKRKNIRATIKAIEILKEKGYNATLTVVGDIKDRDEYESIIKYDFVKYIKPIPKEELLDIYRGSDIFVMPSITETFGLVYPEAMSQGLPIIYTRGMGFDGNFKEGEVGYSVDCFDYEEIAEKIIAILDNYERLSKDSIKLSSKFNWQEIAKEYIEIYSNVIK